MEYSSEYMFEQTQLGEILKLPRAISNLKVRFELVPGDGLLLEIFLLLWSS